MVRRNVVGGGNLRTMVRSMFVFQFLDSAKHQRMKMCSTQATK